MLVFEMVETLFAASANVAVRDPSDGGTGERILHDGEKERVVRVVLEGGTTRSCRWM